MKTKCVISDRLGVVVDRLRNEHSRTHRSQEQMYIRQQRRIGQPPRRARSPIAYLRIPVVDQQIGRAVRIPRHLPYQVQVQQALRRAQGTVASRRPPRGGYKRARAPLPPQTRMTRQQPVCHTAQSTLDAWLLRIQGPRR